MIPKDSRLFPNHIMSFIITHCVYDVMEINLSNAKDIKEITFHIKIKRENSV